MASWLIDCFLDWVIERSPDTGLTNCFRNGMIDLSMDWSTDYLTLALIIWLIDSLVNKLNDRSTAGWLTDWLLTSLNDKLTACFLNGLTDWLIDQLTALLTERVKVLTVSTTQSFFNNDSLSLQICLFDSRFFQFSLDGLCHAQSLGFALFHGTANLCLFAFFQLIIWRLRISSWLEKPH